MPQDFGIPNPDDPFGLPPLPREFFDPPFAWEKPVFPHLKYGPATIRILVVADGSISYGFSQNGFTLAIALGDIPDTSHPDHPSYARFEFTRAHRGSSATGISPGFSNFTFAPGSLDNFDEVWLFGINSGAPYLSATEDATLEAFMDNGGGVLAMGDHEALGLGLCGGIKRVRSMRKWWFESVPIPAGMEKAPDITDLTRNDTQQPPLPGSQSDHIPQPIYPNYRYAYPYWAAWWRRQKYPHPILCGPRGAITVYPDHAHEGDCIMPAAVNAGEFPGGVPVEIIAEGRNVVGRNKSGFVITDPREFGLLGVWDGHDPDADKGRVVVDSTWHHWFDVNLTGLRAASANSTNYADILAVFRNIAIWLAPKAKQAAMRRAGKRILLVSASFVERAYTLHELRPEKFYLIGVEARDALGRIAPQCQSAAWFDFVVAPVFSKDLRRIALKDRFEGVHNLIEAAAIEAMAMTAFGGAINALAVEINKRGFENIAELDDEMDSIIERGARMGIDVARKQMREGQRTVQLLLDERGETKEAD